jgi:hypothetical protein
MKKLTTFLFAIAMAAFTNAQQTPGDVILTGFPSQGVIIHEQTATVPPADQLPANVNPAQAGTTYAYFYGGTVANVPGWTMTNRGGNSTGGSNVLWTTYLAGQQPTRGWSMTDSVYTRFQSSSTTWDTLKIPLKTENSSAAVIMNGQNVQNDAFLFSPEITLEQGRIYVLTFWIGMLGNINGTSGFRHIDINLHTSATHNSSVQSLEQLRFRSAQTGVSSSSFAWLNNDNAFEVFFIAPGNGNYVLSFNDVSPAHASFFNTIYLADIKLVASEIAEPKLISTTPENGAAHVWGAPVQAVFGTPVTTTAGVTLTPNNGGVVASVREGVILNIAHNALTPGETYEVFVPAAVSGMERDTSWTFTTPTFENYFSLEHFPATINNNTANMPAGWRRHGTTTGDWELRESSSIFGTDYGPREGSGGFLQSTSYISGTADRVNVGLFSPRFPELTVGKEYTVTFWTRTVREHTYDLDLVLCKGNGIGDIVQTAGSVQMENTTEWTEHKITFIAKVNGITNIGFRHRSTRTTTSTFLHLDGIKFEEGDDNNKLTFQMPAGGTRGAVLGARVTPTQAETNVHVDVRISARFNMIELGDVSGIRIVQSTATAINAISQSNTWSAPITPTAVSANVITGAPDSIAAELVLTNARLALSPTPARYVVIIPPAAIVGLTDTVIWAFTTSTLAQTITFYTDSINRMQTNINNLNSSLTTTQRNLTDCQGTLTTCQGDLETRTQERNECNSSLLTAGFEIGDLKDTIAAKNAEIERLLEELKNCGGSSNAILQQLPQSKINVFPNPTSSELHIVDFDFKQGDLVQLYDLNGKVVFQERVNAVIGNFTINVSGLQNGAYILRIGHQVTQIVKN